MRMTRKGRRRVAIAVILVGGVLGAAALLMVGTCGVRVMVDNHSPSAIKNVRVYYTGGTIAVPILEPGVVHTTRVNPDGDSALRLEWIDTSGRRYSKDINTYFQHNYRGTITITINPDSSVTTEANIKLPSPL